MEGKQGLRILIRKAGLYGLLFLCISALVLFMGLAAPSGKALAQVVALPPLYVNPALLASAAPDAVATATASAYAPEDTPMVSPAPTRAPAPAIMTTSMPTPTVTPTSAITTTIPPTPAVTFTPTIPPTSTPTPSAAPTPTVSPTPAVTPTPSPRVTPTPVSIPTPSPAPSVSPKDGEALASGHPVVWTETRYAVDFDYLRGINPSVAGWLFQPDGELSFPFSQGTDNQYYQKRTFDNNRKSYSSAFLDCDSAADFTDGVTYLFASVSEDGPFASLKSYGEQAYYEAHSRLVLLTPGGDHQVELFAGLSLPGDDEASWRISPPQTEREFQLLLDSLTSQSIFAPQEDSLPVLGDQLLVLTAPPGTRKGPRIVLFGRMRPIVYSTGAAVAVDKLPTDHLPTGNGETVLPGVGTFMIYAQNDPLWNDCRFETLGSSKKRKFGEGGCGPTAVAIALANLVPKDDLPLMTGFAASPFGFTFCACSVNHYYCSHKHVQYRIQTPEEYLRYLPMAVASFASGNNIWGVLSRSMAQGTSMRFLDKLCYIYSISITTTRVAREAVDLLMAGNGKRVVLCSATWGSPFTRSGHFVVMLAADEEYVYLADPLRSNDYKNLDRFGYVEELAPNVVRIRQENITKCNLSPHYVLEAFQR